MNKLFVCLGLLLLCSSIVHAQEADGYFELPRGYGFQEDRASSKNLNASSNSVSKIPTQDLLVRFCASYPMVVVADVPSAYRPKIEIKQPSSLAVVTNQTLVIKGINGFMTPTFVNDKGIQLGENGQFYTEYKLDSFGKTPVFITFLTPDKHFFTVRRDVISLATPQDIDQFALQQKYFVAFFNSGYLYNPHSNRLLNDPFTRADLAYFVWKLSSLVPTENGMSNFQDVPAGSWFNPAVFYATSHRIMAEFPDGLFYPEKPVTKLEFVMTVLRALHVSLDNSVSVLPFKDIKEGHWSVKFVRTALKEGLIKSDAQFNGDTELKLSDFMLLSQSISSVETSVTSYSRIEKETKVSTQNIESFLYPVMQSLSDIKIDFVEKTDVSKNKLEFLAPDPFVVTMDANVVFSGDVFPPKTFMLGDINIVPSADGRFMYVVSLNIGETTLKTSQLDKQFVFTLIRLDGYTDLRGHWSEMTAAKLKALRILPLESELGPSKGVTRAEFVLWLSRALQWSLEPVELPRLPKDLDKDNPNYLTYLKAVQLGILSLDGQGNFKPNSVLNKADAVAALMQAIPLNLFPVAYTGRFPYYDVPTTHWARQSIVAALRAGVISPSKTFSPNKELTRAELVVLLSRLPSVQKQLDTAFLPQGH